MKILVPTKRVIDAYVRIRVKPDHSGVETEHVKMSINPFDEIAIEEALRIKESDLWPDVESITLVSMGPNACQESLRAGLALGADRAIHIITEEQDFQPLDVAKVLANIAQREQTDLVIMGKQAIDDDSNQVGQMLAALLDWPQGTFAYKLEYENHSINVTREIDGGLETLCLSLPAVLTTDLRLNIPRYASLPAIMKSKSKPLETLSLKDLSLVFSGKIKRTKVEPPPSRQPGKILNSVDELVAVLREKEQVI